MLKDTNSGSEVPFTFYLPSYFLHMFIRGCVYVKRSFVS